MEETGLTVRLRKMFEWASATPLTWLQWGERIHLHCRHSLHSLLYLHPFDRLGITAYDCGLYIQAPNLIPNQTVPHVTVKRTNVLWKPLTPWLQQTVDWTSFTEGIHCLRDRKNTFCLLENTFVSFSVKPEEPGWSRAKRASGAPQFNMRYKKVSEGFWWTRATCQTFFFSFFTPISQANMNYCCHQLLSVCLGWQTYLMPCITALCQRQIMCLSCLYLLLINSSKGNK